MTELFLLAGLALIALIVWQANRAREIARRAGREACERVAVQFLDDTVVQRRWWLARDARGHLQLCRWYEFEFAVDGVRRARGEITLRGWRVTDIRLDRGDGPGQTLIS
jgi:hypothetical protein